MPAFKPPKIQEVTWNTWRKGLNTLFRETEIDGSELAAAQDLLLVGSGIPTKRWGSANYFQSAPSTSYMNRGLGFFKDTSDNIQILATTDWGTLVKQSGASYTPITGFSWPSGYNVEMTQLNNYVYFSSSQKPLARYDFTTLAGFNTLAIPTGLTLTNFSGATGNNTWSWKVTTVGYVGETMASTPISLTSLPQNLTQTTMILKWTAVSAASGQLVGYNIYRGFPGSEFLLASVGSASTQYVDTGAPTSSLTVPVSDGTAGIAAKYILRFQDRLVLAGIPGSPTAVYISAPAPQETKFDGLSGGAYLKIEPDSGEDITGLGTYYQSSTFSQTIIVFKERSVWEIHLSFITFGNYSLLLPTYRLLTNSRGCSSHRSIVAVENDIMFANSRGIYLLRYEPQLLNVINASEISAKVRPYFQGLTNADITSASAVYSDKKYIVSYPGVKQSMMFDRERLAFMGPWNTLNGVNKWVNFVDSTGVERTIASDSNDNFVTEFRSSYSSDNGTAFRSILRTKKEDGGDWTIFKNITEVYALFAAVTGSVSINVYLEQRNGATVTAVSFSVTSAVGQTGFGTDLMGLQPFGLSNNTAKFASTETPKKRYIYKTARTIQYEVITTNSGDNYQLLGFKTIFIPQARGNNPSSWLS